MRMHPTARAFTLVEMLIAIGALFLVSLGIATIFDSTGKTISTGRRISAMNEYAAMLETRFRNDFESMTREGFLIIRHEYADEARVVPLHADDRSARRRRVDELMFFTKGSVSSAREALEAGYPATSNEASIYFGHGQQQRENLSNNSLYLRPNVADNNYDPTSQLGVDTAGNPNRFASDWNLLRHVTVLAQPEASISRIFGNGQGKTPYPSWSGNNIDWVIDGEYQIGLRPAASSLFRTIAAFDPTSTKPPVPLGLYVSGNGTPQLASGLVDIATSDLAEIRQIVTTVSAQPNTVSTPTILKSLLQANGGRASSMGFMQSWMDDALPAWSMSQNFVDRSRMRAEPSAPDFMGVLDEVQGSPSPREALFNSIQRANQMSIASSVFIPSCSEFIVEWSFGKVDDQGRMIWHGKDRWIDLNDNGKTEDEEHLVAPYGAPPVNVDDTMSIPLYVRDPRALIFPPSGNANSPANPLGVDSWPVSPSLIHGAFEINPRDPLTSYFGYFDPTFSPDLRNNAGLPQPDGDADDAGDALSPTIPWAWPEMIRITLSLTDPKDPTIEQTFQFVFDAPGNPVY